MKICFYAGDKYWGGLGPTGGSRTILKSAATLRKFGHRVDVVARNDRFPWFKHPKVLSVIPKDVDVVVAIAVTDIEPMIAKAPRNAALAYWARPFETWQRDSKSIYSILLNFQNRSGLIMCNSQWQVDKLHKNGIKAELQYAGLDFEDFYNDGEKSPKTTIGALHSKLPRKQFQIFEELMKKGGENFNYYTFGNKSYVGSDRHVKQPTTSELRRFYSSCDIWVSTTRLEGFHNPPTEAALCGCLVMCFDSKHNGCMDYVNAKTGETYKTVWQLIKNIENADYSKIEEMRKLLRSKIGSRTDNMKKMAETLNWWCDT